MVKVITYGTYDLIHYGHIRLLERAKALGDYLIVGVTADDFDKTRGKINVQQSLMERIEGVRATGLADEIIVEEYEGQKIDDIRRYGVDIFTVGSDWVGKFDYLNEYCKVVYLDRTEGVSSSEIRAEKSEIRLGLVGYSPYLNKVFEECKYVNGINVSALCSHSESFISDNIDKYELVTSDYEVFLKAVDAVYIHSNPSTHYAEIKKALESGKHVLCESPISMNIDSCIELYTLAKQGNLVLLEALRTAYSTAYARLLLLIKGGKIGNVVSVDSVCTSLNTNLGNDAKTDDWGSITAWGPTAMLPIFQLLGTNYTSYHICSKINESGFDEFTKIDFLYRDAVASIKVGTGAKSEGELIISGTKGYAYVPAPWWKTDYFEIRYENPADNKRYFYQLDGEGIRYEMVDFLKTINGKISGRSIETSVTESIVKVIESFMKRKNLSEI